MPVQQGIVEKGRAGAVGPRLFFVGDGAADLNDGAEWCLLEYVEAAILPPVDGAAGAHPQGQGDTVSLPV
ncbi:MAG: hypothetical protein GKR89_34555 [Candidatus Latescibacteria bacterium]|nr:hypothetical protein [Candidatus Latescibacterota bacterium]